jgi:hypothetical protein
MKLIAALLRLAALHCTSALLLPNIGEKAVTHAASAAAVREWLAEHCAAPCVLGFDTETQPAFRKGQAHPPAVVQLATADACLVAQIFVARSRRDKSSGQRTAIPATRRDEADAIRHALTETLASRSIIKAGVGIDDDAVDLWQFWGLELNARLELGGGPHPMRGLARLCADATGIRLSKPGTVQKSNWALPLGEKQVAYAAADAWAGVAVYERACHLDEATYSHESPHHGSNPQPSSSPAALHLTEPRRGTNPQLLKTELIVTRSSTPHGWTSVRGADATCDRAASL